jgi:hypothetical protein
MPQGEQNVDRNHSANHSGVNADRCDSKLAAQQIVGLWTERWSRAGLDYIDHSGADGTIVRRTFVRQASRRRMVLGNLEILFNLRRLTMKQLKFLSAIFMAFALLTAAGCASTPKQEGTGEYIDDSVITTKVKAAILNEPTLKSAEINVETFKGTVQLSGFVTSRADMNKAVEVARSVNGVTSVKSDMRLK